MSNSDADIRSAGLKVTAPRVRVLNFLENHSERHLSAEDVYDGLRDLGEDIGLATVYRVLAQFEQAGLVIRHHFESGSAIFELANTEHHDHMICLECNRVLEFHDPVIEAQQEKVAKKYKFKIEGHSMYLYGKCSECA